MARVTSEQLLTAVDGTVRVAATLAREGKPVDLDIRGSFKAVADLARAELEAEVARVLADARKYEFDVSVKLAREKGSPTPVGQYN